MPDAQLCGVPLISKSIRPPEAMSACVRTGVARGRPLTVTLLMYGLEGAPGEVMTSGREDAGRSMVTLSKKGLRREARRHCQDLARSIPRPWPRPGLRVRVLTFR